LTYRLSWTDLRSRREDDIIDVLGDFLVLTDKYACVHEAEEYTRGVERNE